MYIFSFIELHSLLGFNEGSKSIQTNPLVLGNKLNYYGVILKGASTCKLKLVGKLPAEIISNVLEMTDTDLSPDQIYLKSTYF